VKTTIDQELGKNIRLEISHKNDIRNYKVSIERAKNILSFHPHHNVKLIVRNLLDNMAACCDWDNPNYYNILVFKALQQNKHSNAVSIAATSDL
jgi:predicted transglutaminase-like protease